MKVPAHQDDTFDQVCPPPKKIPSSTARPPLSPPFLPPSRTCHLRASSSLRSLLLSHLTASPPPSSSSAGVRRQVMGGQSAR
eukprot:3685414-Rhodomonas_salina.1